MELVWSILISGMLLALGLFYLARQWSGWRQMRHCADLSRLDRRHFYAQFLRRATGALLFVLTGVTIFLAQTILDWQESKRLYVWMWAGVLMSVFLMICLAGFESWAIVRYARRHRKELVADGREIARELAAHRGRVGQRRPYPPSGEVERN